MLSMSRIVAAAGTQPICTAYLTISEIASVKLTAQQNNWYLPEQYYSTRLFVIMPPVIGNLHYLFTLFT